MTNHYKHIQCISANLETSSRTLKFANIRTEGFWVIICSFSVKHFQVSFFAAQNNGCKKKHHWVRLMTCCQCLKIFFLHKVDYVKQAKLNKSKDVNFKPISNIKLFAYSYPFSIVSHD